PSTARARPAHGSAGRRGRRRPSDTGRIALPLRRHPRGAAPRPDGGTRHAPEHRLGHRGALRAGPAAHGRAGRLRRRSRGAGLSRPGPGGAMTAVTRQAYAEMFGPTVGDRIRLADTDLVVEVE